MWCHIPFQGPPSLPVRLGARCGEKLEGRWCCCCFRKSWTALVSSNKGMDVTVAASQTNNIFVLVIQFFFLLGSYCINLSWHCTLSVQNNRNLFLLLSCTPFWTQNSLNLLGHGLYKVSKAFHRDAGPCWLQCFPTVVSSWLVVDLYSELLAPSHPTDAQLDWDLVTGQVTAVSCIGICETIPGQS